MKIRIGIFFGGSSREREVSFAGGRTVYDNLDKRWFEPVPIFVDAFGQFILLDWHNIYKGSIRDFYPAAAHLPEQPHSFQIYAESLNPSPAQQKEMAQAIGKLIPAAELATVMDFAFLALHGSRGEDGSIQGLLEWYNIPYSGSGIFASALGMSKSMQKQLQSAAGLYVNKYRNTGREWLQFDEAQKQALFEELNKTFNGHFVLKPANQGSSLGVSIMHDPYRAAFDRAMDLAFFKLSLETGEWNSRSPEDKVNFIRDISDLRHGLGLPLLLDDQVIYMPADLLHHLDDALSRKKQVVLQAMSSETEVIAEEYLDGKEFSCIVIRDEREQPLALPPTEIRKSGTFFDYRSKYMPGLSSKVTPIEAPEATVTAIRDACKRLFEYFRFNVYARIDGFVNASGEIFLNDPNTTSGMMPSSFFFHQAAEIGLDPSHFLTYIVKRSLVEREDTAICRGISISLLQRLETMKSVAVSALPRRKIAVIMGGYSFERHISMESGRNIYEKLSSSEDFEPVPVFLAGDVTNYSLYRLPINFMLKDNADDIRDKVLHFKPDPVMQAIRDQAAGITRVYSGHSAVMEPTPISMEELRALCDGVFIALHGRPGEDGTLQQEFARHGLYHNGSLASSAAITIDKFETNRILREAGFLVADHTLVQKADWERDPEAAADSIIERFGLPFIAKPHDDGCSAAVFKVKQREELLAYAKGIFRPSVKTPLEQSTLETLKLKSQDEFPAKEKFLVEKFIDANGAERFLEVTGGMLSHMNPDGSIRHEFFEPSESLAESEILSLEEKFLAGEGQNLTPSRFSKDPAEQVRISAEVRKTLEAVARTLNVTGYCRIDAFVRIFADSKVETVIIEVNSLPGMTPATCIYHQAALNNYKPLEFIREILKFGEQRAAQHA